MFLVDFVFSGELDNMRRLIQVLGEVPYVELLSSVKDEELAQPVQELLLHRLRIVNSVVEHLAPLNLNDWQAASLVPDGDRSGILFVEDRD